MSDPVELFSAESSDEIVLVRASSVTPQRVDFAWDPWSPIGMVTVLVGLGGLGKSVLFARLAAGWSRGTIPGDLHGVPVDVAIASAEDHRQAVILPRLIAAGADLSRIHFIEHRIDGEASDIAIDGEVAAIEAALVAGNVRVLLIDTVIAHIPTEHDTYNEQRVRAVLKPLAKMAERNSLVVFGTMHLNRRDARDVLTRISGSGGFGNLARSVLLLARDPDDPDGHSRILALGKSNVGGRTPALKLTLEPCRIPNDDGEEIPTVRLIDSGESSYTPSDLLGPSEDDDKLSAVGEAADFLREYLADGPVEAKTVKDAAKVAGIAERTLWRAVNRLRVKTNDRTAFGPGHPSRWSLPSLLNPPDFIGTVDTVGNVGTVGVDVPSIPSVPRDLPTEPYGTQIARAREASNGLPADWLEQDDARRLALLDAGRRRLELSPRRRR
jgi:hypothetical protein